jgi:GAF domain-containing protein
VISAVATLIALVVPRVMLGTDFPYRQSSPNSTSTILTSVEHLDVAAVIQLSQAISGETVLDKLIDTLMRSAIEQAGAQRGLLILAQGDGYRIVAEATTGGDTVAVGPRRAWVTAADLPLTVLNYVVRTKESIRLRGGSEEDQFLADDYFRDHHLRAVLCLPLIKEIKLIGMLYLENNLAAHVFTPDRVIVLKLLASEAAIALENIRLYDELWRRPRATSRRARPTAPRPRSLSSPPRGAGGEVIGHDQV